ncbi:hypothetical protein EYZ11_003163 [Aspergillus tanneri]|uniref:Probable beta-glucosidase M n=1 Tax=Aspergillus tanneri TaxID=1220188 RepID=A0A4S3JNS5_9EURO|nr:hypothetical protein EYZ11_003163 [Aspergillus tanneri]
MHSYITSLVSLVGVLSLGYTAATLQNITNDSYFYGDSPPVYPSPEGTGTGEWALAYEKAKKLVASLTPEERVKLTAGVNADNSCSGNIPSIPRLNFPGLCVSDAGNGLRGTDYVNVGIKLFPGKGASTWVIPTSVAHWFTKLFVEYNLQVWHYILNEQETYRNPQKLNGLDIAAISSNIDDKTMHELYLWPFQDAVRAGTASIMCSYQRINNSYGCQNSKTLNGLLKTELGFQGYVISDWGAQHAGIATANAGLDMAMPSTKLWGPKLTEAIENGTMEASRLDDMATRILATWYKLKQDVNFPPSGIGMPKDVNADHQVIVGITPASKQTLLQNAIEGHVLVKNINNALPLRSPSPPIQGNHTLYVGGGSGANSPAYISAPLDALQAQASQDGSSLIWDITSLDPAVNPTSDTCLVFINSYATEGYDRPGLVDETSDVLVTNVASKCDSTVVVVHNAGIRLVNAWINHQNVTAVIFAHLPGQDSGRSVVELLYGRSNPSGKLPYTVAKKAEDYGQLLHPMEAKEPFGLFPQDNFSEGIFIDYRAFDQQGIEPQFEFGFGLSYTTFDYSGLHIDTVSAINTPYPPPAAVQEGGNPHLWDALVRVRVQVKNSGSADGDEVAQLYVGIPNGPIRQLRGFEKAHITTGSTANVMFSLTRRDLSVWDTNAQQWWLQPGTYQVFVGRSSRDLPLRGHFTL